MAPYSLFRIGAGILVFHGILHLIGHFGQMKAEPVNGMERTLQDLLYNYRTDLMGTMRSKGELLDGLSLAWSVMLLTLGALGFVQEVKQRPALVYGAGLVLAALISLKFFFIVPTLLLAAAAICFSASASLNR